MKVSHCLVAKFAWAALSDTTQIGWFNVQELIAIHRQCRWTFIHWTNPICAMLHKVAKVSLVPTQCNTSTGGFGQYSRKLLKKSLVKMTHWLGASLALATFGDTTHIGMVLLATIHQYCETTEIYVILCLLKQTYLCQVTQSSQG